MWGVQAWLLGAPWMDPSWLLDRFHTEFVVLALVIVFVECGLLFPLLPGDTLLVSIGLFIATDQLNVAATSHVLDLLLCIALCTGAALLGSAAGYEIGRAIGTPVRAHDGRILRKKYLDRTVEFFDRRGSQALVAGRFVPFVRTYVTLVAGVSKMPRPRFLWWSAFGAALWVTSVMCFGFFVGRRLPWVARNIDLLVLVLLVVSVVPIVIEWWRERERQPPPESRRS